MGKTIEQEVESGLGPWSLGLNLNGRKHPGQFLNTRAKNPEARRGHQKILRRILIKRSSQLDVRISEKLIGIHGKLLHSLRNSDRIHQLRLPVKSGEQQLTTRQGIWFRQVGVILGQVKHELPIPLKHKVRTHKNRFFWPTASPNLSCQFLNLKLVATNRALRDGRIHE